MIPNAGPYSTTRPGRGNPHCQTVADAERLAIRYAPLESTGDTRHALDELRAVLVMVQPSAVGGEG